MKINLKSVVLFIIAVSLAVLIATPLAAKGSKGSKGSNAHHGSKIGPMLSIFHGEVRLSADPAESNLVDCKSTELLGISTATITFLAGVCDNLLVAGPACANEFPIVIHDCHVPGQPNVQDSGMEQVTAVGIFNICHDQTGMGICDGNTEDQTVIMVGTTRTQTTSIEGQFSATAITENIGTKRAKFTFDEKKQKLDKAFLESISYVQSEIVTKEFVIPGSPPLELPCGLTPPIAGSVGSADCGFAGLSVTVP